MVYQDAWTDERAKEGIARFPNAKQAVMADFSVEDEGVALSAKLIDIGEAGYSTTANWEYKCKSEELPERLFDVLKEVGARTGHNIEHDSWQSAFGTQNTQAMLSFLVGLGNLSALQGRCVPAPSDQLLNPLMDALNRDPEMDATMEAIPAVS